MTAVFLVLPAAEVEGRHVVDPAAFARGGDLVDALEIGGHDPGVNLRREQRGVAEHFLDVPDIGPALEHFGGAGMPERVDGDRARQPGRVAVVHEDSAQDVGLHHGAAIGQEEAFDGFASVSGEQERPHGIEVFGDEAEGHFADGDDAILATFSEDDAHRAILDAHIVGGEFADLRAAKAGRIKDLHDRSIAEAGRRAQVRLVHPAQHLVVGDDALRKPVGFSQRWEVRERIHDDFPSQFQERIKPLHRVDLEVAVGGADRLAVGLGTMKKVFVIIEKLLELRVAQIGPAAIRFRGQPPEERLDVFDAMLDGERCEVARVKMLLIKFDERMHFIRPPARTAIRGNGEPPTRPTRADACDRGPSLIRPERRGCNAPWWSGCGGRASPGCDVNRPRV